MTLEKLIENNRNLMTEEQRLELNKVMEARRKETNKKLRTMFKSLEVTDELLNKRCTI